MVKIAFREELLTAHLNGISVIACNDKIIHEIKMNYLSILFVVDAANCREAGIVL